MRPARILLALIPMIALSCCAGNAPRAAALRALMAPAHAQTLDSAVKELGALKPPVGAQAGVFEQLRDELMRQLNARGVSKFTSTPPSGDANRVNDLGITSNGDGTYTLLWSYYNRGDYDQNGSVGVTDITPIAMHFGEAVPSFNPDAIQYVIHPNSAPGEKVCVADVTPIAMNFGVDCAKYEVQGAPATGDFSPIHVVMMDDAYNTENGRAKFGYSFSIGANRRFRVVPMDSANIAGVESNEASVNPTAPSIVSVQPLTGDKNAPLSLVAVVNGTQPLSYEWQFGADASPNVSYEPSPTVTFSTVKVHDCTLTVTNAYGEDTYNFSVDVKETAKPPLELWYFQMVNLLPAGAVDNALALMQTAKNAGYTKALIADFKFGTIDIQSDTYRANVQAFANGARAMGMEVVPSLVPIGYSDAYLCHDPNLIEGMPVVNAEFLALNHDPDVWADVVQDAVISNGGFEAHSGNDFDGWLEMDSAYISADATEKHSGAASAKISPSGGNNARITTPDIPVKPWNGYAVKLWLKTENASPAGSIWFRVFNWDPGASKLTQICFQDFSVAATQDWKEYILTFNSQDYTSVRIYLGMWGGQSGQFWFDDVSIENTGLINLIRRPGAPLVVTDENGLTTYNEGSDYDPVIDPEMGEAGSYTGTFDLYHARPVITIPTGSRIQDGDILKVSYYQCAFVMDMQPTVCLTEPAVDTITRDTLQLINDLMDPSEVFISVDEMRVANWCKSCQDTGKTPGQLLADMTARIETIAHEINPAWKLLTWSDMYDPNHNAHDDYYLVNGDLANSWDGLPASWDIGNWLSSSDPTLEFFQNHGNRQLLAGYYDEGAKANAEDYYIYGWLTRARNLNADGVYGAMYTTWVNDFSQLENWAASVRQWETDNP